MLGIFNLEHSEMAFLFSVAKHKEHPNNEDLVDNAKRDVRE